MAKAKAKATAKAKTKTVAKKAVAQKAVAKPAAKPAAKAAPAAKPAAKPKKAAPEKAWTGQRWAFFGELSIWPTYHRASPQTLATRRGALVTDVVDDSLDVIVFGDRPGSGRSEAKKRADKLVAKGGKLQILDEAAYRE